MVNLINQFKETAKHLNLAILGALLFLLALWLQKVLMTALGHRVTLAFFSITSFCVYWFWFNQKPNHAPRRIHLIGKIAGLYALILAIGYTLGYLGLSEEFIMGPTSGLGLIVLVLMEEICFRGLLIRLEHFNKLPQFILPALIFSLVHFIDTDFHFGMALQRFVGALLLFSLCTRGNISNAILVHFIFNAGTSILTLSEKDHADLYFIASTTLVNLYLIYTLKKGPYD